MLCFRCGSHNPDGSEFCSQCGQKFIDKKKKPPKDPTSPEICAASAEDQQTLEVGTQVAERYEILSLVGAGPVGVVYRSHDLEIDVDVAIKILSPSLLQSREERKRFLSEIRRVRKIRHSNVVRLYDEDHDEDQIFFTMQMLEGLSLRKIIRLRKEKGQSFALREINPIFSHLCQALDQAHETTAHGDLKPENVIVLPDMLKVTDFGLINALPHRPFVAAQKKAFGGGAYLAPEVRDDKQELQPTADIYSMGVILCEMLSGEIYEGPSSSLPRLPKEFEALSPVIKRALNENPTKRHSSPRELFEELHSIATGPRQRTTSPPRPAPRRPEPEARTPREEKKPAVRPPRTAPPRSKAVQAIGEAVDPPTVVDAELQPDEEPLPAGKLAKPAEEEEALEELAGDAETEGVEEIDEVEEFLDEDEEVEGDEDVDESIDIEPEDDLETFVTTPIEKETDLRVARPKDESRPPSDEDDVSARLVDDPEQVQVLEARKRQDPQPDRAAVSEPPPEAYSQPPYGYSQPPPSSRLPVYIFLSVITVIVGTGVYFLVDYLIAAKQQLTQVGTQVAAVGPAQPSFPGQEKPGPDAKTQEEARLAEQRRKVEEYLKAEQARLAEERRKLEEARKSDKGRLAAMAPKPKESRKAFEARKAAERRKAEEKRKAEERRLAEARRKAEDKRKAEEKRKAEKARKAEEARRAEERRLAEERRKAAASKPMLEEVPVPGRPASVQPAPARPKPPPAEKKPKEVARVIEPTKAPAEPAKGNCPRGMAFVSDGAAYIGSATNDPMRNFGEKKLHKVEMKAYCIDRYEYPNAPGHKPRASVSWKLADKLCRKRGKRLCTEEEWEYACKGKSDRSFPYGKRWDPNLCNTEDGEGSDRDIAAAGAFKRCRSPFGVLDMSGNVSEWTASKYQPNAGARTYKGGSAMRPNWATRCATRSSLSPGARKSDLGFRCCAKPM